MTESTLTPRGLRTRERIVDAAADLVLAHGVHETTLDHVREATGTSKSQLFHYFPAGKTELIHAVAQRQGERVLHMQQQLLRDPSGWADLRAWRNAVVDYQRAQHCAGGCPIGSLASELADHDEVGRMVLVAAFGQWRDCIRDAILSLRDRGLIAADAPVEDLALASLATVQGGLLLAQTARDTRPLAIAMDAAIDHLQAHAPAG